MPNQEEKDSQQVLTETPWSAILIPLGVALIVVIAFIVLVIRGSNA